MSQPWPFFHFPSLVVVLCRALYPLLSNPLPVLRHSIPPTMSLSASFVALL